MSLAARPALFLPRGLSSIAPSARRSLFALLPAGLLAAAAAGCGDDTGGGGGGGGGEDARPTCEEIGELCHESTTTLGQECHEFGEDAASTEAECKARQDECKAECG